MKIENEGVRKFIELVEALPTVSAKKNYFASFNESSRTEVYNKDSETNENSNKDSETNEKHSLPAAFHIVETLAGENQAEELLTNGCDEATAPFAMSATK